MKVEYLDKDYKKINIGLEEFRIYNYHDAELMLNPNNKMCCFILGMLFAHGADIKILNEKDLDLTSVNKSFSLMAYVWSKLSDDNFPSQDFSNVKTEMDKRIENVKRMGVKTEKIVNAPEYKKLFLICPVRRANEEQRKVIEDFVENKKGSGFKIHAPHINTVQTDLFGGYAICKQNAEALASSCEVVVYYDPQSTGSAFDLGVAYALRKKLILLNGNTVEFNPDDPVDNLIQNWPYRPVLTKDFPNEFENLLNDRGLILQRKKN